MRNTLFILGTLVGTTVMAQNSAVINAFNSLEDNQLAEAAGYIEPAILNEGTMVKEKTWRYRGQIYQRIVFSDDTLLKTRFPDAMEKAIASFTKANQLDTKAVEKEANDKALRGLQAMALNAGNDAFTAKDYDRAISLYGQSEAVAKSFGETDSNAVFNSALAYESKGDLVQALARYQQCIAIGYDKPEIYRYTASLQKRNKELDAAIATTQAGRKRHPNDKELMLDEVAFLQEAGRVSEVKSSAMAALEKDPANCVLHSVLASIYEAEADPKGGTKPAEAEMSALYDKAEASYKKSIECDPKFFDSYFNIGVLYNNRAAYEYEKANNEKDDAKYQKLKKVADDIYIKAVPYFEKAHELKPDDVPTIKQLKTLYAKAGNTAKFEEMQQLLNEGPKGSTTNSNGPSNKTTGSNTGTIAIPLRQEGGVYLLDIVVNGQPLKGVVYDSGASSVSMSATEAMFMMKQGYLGESDFVGTENFMTADGKIQEGAIVNLKSLQIGSQTLRDVRASVSYSLSAPVLLGQSALSRFKSVSVDNGKKVLLLVP